TPELFEYLPSPVQRYIGLGAGGDDVALDRAGEVLEQLGGAFGVEADHVAIPGPDVLHLEDASEALDDVGGGGPEALPGQHRPQGIAGADLAFDDATVRIGCRSFGVAVGVLLRGLGLEV